MGGQILNSHLNKVSQWAMFRSTTATAKNGVVPLVLRGQDATNSHLVFGGVVDLLPNKTYIISAGLPNDSSTSSITVKNLGIQRSTDGGTTWSNIWGSGLSGATGATSAGTSVTDVYTATVPTKIRLNSGAKPLVAGVWLYLEVK